RCGDEPEKGHNRWHPDIPPVVEADPGEEVVMQTRHAFDGQITPTTIADDLLGTDLGLVGTQHVVKDQNMLVPKVFGSLGKVFDGGRVCADLRLWEYGS
ncbi:MAG: acetamidase/formamidase family protein, partial [Chloroflexota bacterium]|nr:acetamidase/formamidase family protein [Chloroflexota bacterium]